MDMFALAKAEAAVGLSEVRRPIPEPKAFEVRIKVSKTAICGTDIHIWHYNDWAKKAVPIPTVTGHEYFGRIDKLGEGVEGFKVGDRVTGEGHIVCQKCDLCRNGLEYLCKNGSAVGISSDGAFAEYLVLPAHNVIPVPDFIDDETAAILDPLANAVHTAATYNVFSKDVIVTGAGPLGMMMAEVARMSGARTVTITDINEDRKALAKKLTKAFVADPSKNTTAEIAKLAGTDTGQFDIALETTGNGRVLADLVDNLKRAGQIAMLGIIPNGASIAWDTLVFGELNIKGVNGRVMFDTWRQVFAVIKAGFDLKPFISHRMSAKDWKKGFELMLEGKASKVVFDWDNIK